MHNFKVEKEIKMKKYKGNRKYENICKLMEDKGMQVDTRDFDNGGDFASFKGVWHDTPLAIILNTFNGQFMVFNMSGDKIATHTSTEFDKEQWYNELLDTFYESL
jgi:hypothetical protein